MFHLVDEVSDTGFDGVLEGHVGLENQDGEEEDEKPQVRNQSVVPHKNAGHTKGPKPVARQ